MKELQNFGQSKTLTRTKLVYVYSFERGVFASEPEPQLVYFCMNLQQGSVNTRPPVAAPENQESLFCTLPNSLSSWFGGSNMIATQ